MRNPKWHRDEIILALNLYFNLEPGQIHARNPEVIELSEILNKLLNFSQLKTDKGNSHGKVFYKNGNYVEIYPMVMAEIRKYFNY